jgi:hypothetical protein
MWISNRLTGWRLYRLARAKLLLFPSVELVADSVFGRRMLQPGQLNPAYLLPPMAGLQDDTLAAAVLMLDERAAAAGSATPFTLLQVRSGLTAKQQQQQQQGRAAAAAVAADPDQVIVPDSYSQLLQVLHDFDTQKLQRMQQKQPDKVERYRNLGDMLRAACSAAAGSVVLQQQQQQHCNAMPVLYLQADGKVRLASAACLT